MMSIQELVEVFSEDRFFNGNFDIKIDENEPRAFNIKVNHDMSLLLRGGIQISIKLLSFGDIYVKFVDDYSSSMNLVYSTHDFSSERFLNWMKWSLRDFVNQSQVYNL